MISKWKKHYKKWKLWRQQNGNTKTYQVLVLFKIVYSPTFAYFSRGCDILWSFAEGTSRIIPELSKAMMNLGKSYEQTISSLSNFSNSFPEEEKERVSNDDIED